MIGPAYVPQMLPTGKPLSAIAFSISACKSYTRAVRPKGQLNAIEAAFGSALKTLGEIRPWQQSLMR